MNIVLTIVAVVAALVLLARWAWQKEQERLAAIRSAAQMMGFRIEEKVGGDALVAELGALPILQRGHSRNAPCVLRGETAGTPVTLLDYRYTTGSGKNSHTWHQTVAVFSCEQERLPTFQLGPEHFFHRLAEKFGYQDIDLPEDEAFSRAYVLRGDDEVVIRQVFGPQARMQLVSSPGWTVESHGGRLVVYRSGKVSKPAELPAFLADALRIRSALSPS